MNTATPRLFIAATGQNTGKTTTAIGIYSILRKRLGRIGFIKPVGQRFTVVDGKQIDEDSVLIRETFQTQIPIEDMSPVTIEPDFTRRHITEANNGALIQRVQHSFDRASWEKDFAIIEGTGHAGVGASFEMSNAVVARVLSSKVLLIVPGGIGRPIDEAAINKALFDQEGVDVVGVVMNKVWPERMDTLADIARKGFERMGLELVGVVPQEMMLSEPTLSEVCEQVRGRFLCNEAHGRRRIQKVVIGAMSSANLFTNLLTGTLLIVPGDREDVVLSALTRSMEADCVPLAGMVISDNMCPQGRLLELLQQSNIPAIFSSMDSYSIAQRIQSIMVKTLPGDVQKIERIQDLISRHVDVDRILEKLGIPAVG